MPVTKKKSASKKFSATTIEFEFEKSTKNTHRFTEVPDGDEKPLIGTLYVQQSAFPGGAPETLTVVIS